MVSLRRSSWWPSVKTKPEWPKIDWNKIEKFIRWPNPYSLFIQCQSYLTPKYFLMTSNCQRMLATEQIMPCVEQLMWMPSILFRLNSLLLADELRVKMNDNEKNDSRRI